ncbi:hypothetical protein ACLOJK_000774 [Asimina triloba]
MDPVLQAFTAVAVSFIAVSLLCATILVLCRKHNPTHPQQLHENQQRRGRRHRNQQQQLPLQQQQQNSYQTLHLQNRDHSLPGALDESATFDPSISLIAMPDLIAATRNFAPDGIIGDGSFGFVYKAQLANGVTVAVKKLSRDAFQGLREFRAEMETLGKIEHPNLVKMKGYCVSGEERLLIYDYIQRGSLDQWLHDTSASASFSSSVSSTSHSSLSVSGSAARPRPLSWAKRVKIVKGVAAGLQYLHDGCKPRIIHRDIKASNVLLDAGFEAHIADFGLARLVDSSHSHVSTQVAGTMGYMPPEYKDGLTMATPKADVYSFGILMLEVATGRRPNLPLVLGGKELGLLAVWARQMLAENRFMEMLDENLVGGRPESTDGGEEKQGGGAAEEKVKEFFRIASLCASENPTERPNMGAVVPLLARL